jgi:hypothetical protein
MSALFSWVLGFAARGEEQLTAHIVPGLAKGGCYGPPDMGEIANRATP